MADPFQIVTKYHPFVKYLVDDPVRPSIPASDRFGDSKLIFALGEEKPSAIICCAFNTNVPEDEQDLFTTSPLVDCNTAVFYTIWSYQSGAGRPMLLEACNYVLDHLPQIRTFVTLSPKTEMARRFHTSNGAVMFRENISTVNYQYQL